MYAGPTDVHRKEYPLGQTLRGHTGWIRSVAFSPNGTKAVSASDDTTVRLWDIATGQAELVLSNHKYWVRSVAFSPDGLNLVSASGDRTVQVWDSTNGQSRGCYHQITA